MVSDLRAPESAFLLLLQSSLAAMALIALVLLMRRWTYMRLRPRIMSLVWLLVLVKLLVPVVPDNPLNLYQWVPHLAQGERGARMEPTAQASVKPVDSAPHKASENAAAISGTVAHAPEADAASGEPKPASRAASSSDIWLLAGSLAWSGGCLAFILIGTIAGLRYRRRMTASVPIADPEVRAVLQACLERLGIRRAIAVYEHDRLAGPCLYGLLKPAIYLPGAWRLNRMPASSRIFCCTN